MTVKVAINGFGRIGRCTLRAIFELNRKDIEIVAVNGTMPIETAMHLLKYDSVHGNMTTPVKVRKNSFDMGNGPIRWTATRNPAELDWSDVDVVMECTGVFTSKEKAMVYKETGAKRVLVSAPSTGADATIVYGVNHKTLKKSDFVVSCASCTTNCLAPLADVLDSTVGIRHGFMTTVHSYTGDQPTLDANHKDLYRARSAAMSMIPTSTGAAKAVGLVLPKLKGKLDGSAVRVPTPNVSLVDLKFVARRKTTVEEINAAMLKASKGRLRGVLAYDPEPKVSIDFNHNPHSSIYAPAQTRVMNGSMVQVMGWYDNEWGFSCRMIDLAVAMGKLGPVSRGKTAVKRLPLKKIKTPKTKRILQAA